jgi:hypothetical protein
VTQRPEGDGRLVCTVEIPRGSKNKYEYDAVLGGIVCCARQPSTRPTTAFFPTRWVRTATHSTFWFASLNRRSRAV